MNIELTKRELEILAHAAEGLTSEEIAEKIFRGQRTIEKIYFHIYETLGVHSKAHAVAMFVRWQHTGIWSRTACPEAQRERAAEDARV